MRIDGGACKFNEQKDEKRWQNGNDEAFVNETNTTKQNNGNNWDFDLEIEASNACRHY